MYYLFFFFFELFILFLLSRSLTRSLSSFIYHTTRSKKITILFIAVLFFPGTVIHELSHYLTARILFVRTHGMNLLPKIDNDNLKLGYVLLEKPDFLRHLLIGMAPFFTGTSIILGTLYLAAQYNLLNQTFYIALIGYILFEIGNTMFSSKKDMEGAIELLASLAVIFAIAYFVGIRIPSFNPEMIFANDPVKQALEKGTYFLMAPIMIDLLVISALKLFHKH